MKKTLLLLATVSLLAGCASDGSGHCGGAFDYQKAGSLDPVKVEGLNSGTSVSALVVPPEPAHIVPFGQRVPDAKDPRDSHVVCLDVPPAMPPVATPTPPQESAPSVPAPAVPVPGPATSTAPAATPHS